MKLLIVDDSALMRRYLSEMLSSMAGVKIITARDGKDALEMIERENPDVVTLDINMPEMDGLTCLSHIMTRFPRPVVMVSSLTQKGAISTFEALEMGAVDFIEKPGGTVSLNIKDIRSQIVVKVRGAYKQRHLFQNKGRQKASVPHTNAVKPVEVDTKPSVQTTTINGVICIASSTGGPSALENILPFLPASLPLPVIVCQHMPGSFTGVFAERLNTKCPLEVVEVTRTMALEPGKIYIGQGDADCTLSLRQGKPYLVSSPESAEFNWHPSASRLLRSVIKYVPAERTVSAMLTGMGDDGSQEMQQLFSRGGFTVAQRERDCAVFGMPKALIELNGASEVLPLPQISSVLITAASRVSRLGAIKSWG